MKKLTKNFLTTALLAVLTMAGLAFTASNLTVQVAVAQTTTGDIVSGGPQDGGDGKKRPCRPPRCPGNSNTGANPTRPNPSQTDFASDSEYSDWWSGFIEWLFGE